MYLQRIRIQTYNDRRSEVKVHGGVPQACQQLHSFPAETQRMLPQTPNPQQGRGFFGGSVAISVRQQVQSKAVVGSQDQDVIVLRRARMEPDLTKFHVVHGEVSFLDGIAPGKPGTESFSRARCRLFYFKN